MYRKFALNKTTKPNGEVVYLTDKELETARMFADLPSTEVIVKASMDDEEFIKLASITEIKED